MSQNIPNAPFPLKSHLNPGGVIKSLFFLSFLLFSVSAQAATKYWIGSAGGNFSDNANWSTTAASACATNNNTTAPTSSDDVIFTSSCTNSATIDGSATATVPSFTINNGYSGTVTMARNLTVTNSFSQAAGTFSLGTYYLTVGMNFTVSAGTFDAGTGTVEMGNTGNNGTIDVNTAQQFYNLRVNKGPDHSVIHPYVANGDTLQVSNNLDLNEGRLTPASGTATVELQDGASLTVGSNFGGDFSGTDPGAVVLSIVGASARTITIPAGRRLPPVTLNAANTTLTTSGAGTVTIGTELKLLAGTVTASSGVSFSMAKLTQSGGTFNGGDSNCTVTGTTSISGGTFNGLNLVTLALGGTMTLTGGELIAPDNGNINITNNSIWDHDSGTGKFTPGNGTVTFAGGDQQMLMASTLNQDDCAGAVSCNSGVFNKVTLSHSSIFTITEGQTMIAQGALSYTNGYFQCIGGGTTCVLRADGNVTVGAGSDGLWSGSAGALIDINGDGSETVSIAAGALLNALKVSGAPSTFSFTGTGTVTMAGNFTVAANATINMGAVNVTVLGDTSISNGIITLSTGTTDFDRSVTISGGTVTVPASNTSTRFGEGAGAIALSGGTLDASAASTLDFYRTFTLTGGELKAPSGGTLNVRSNSNWDHDAGTGKFTPGSGTVAFIGGDQQLLMASTLNQDDCAGGVSCNSGVFNSVTLGHSSIFYITNGQTVTAAGTFSYTNGYFECVGSGSTCVLQANGNASIGSGTDGGFFSTGATINFNGGVSSTNTITTGGTFPKLIISAGTTVSLANAGTATSYGTTSVSGTLDLAGRNFTSNSTLTVNNGGTLRLQGGETVTAPTLSAGSTVEYTGTNATYTLKNYTYRSLKINGGASTVFSLPSNQASVETLTLTSGILSLAGFNLTASSLDNSTTLRLNGNETVTITTMDTNSGTVEYVGTADYTVTPGKLAAGNAYYHLVFNGSGGQWKQNAAADVDGDLTITAGTLNSSGQAVNVAGNWSNSGTYTSGANTVTFDGGGSKTLVTGGTGDSQDFNNIVVNKPGGTLTINTNALDVDADFTLTAGTFDANGQAMTVFGNWSNSGTFTANSNTVTLDGALQTVGGSSDTTFYNFTKSVSVADTLTFANGRTFSMTGLARLKGVSGNKLTINSAVNGSQASINPSGTRDIQYVSVRDNNNVNGTRIECFTDCNSISNTTNWAFVLPGVGFSASSSSVAEGSAGTTTTLTLPVSLTEALQTVTASVDYAVTGGTATGGGTDYTLASGTLNYATNDSSEDISITLVRDYVDESNETLQITLSNPTNSTLGTSVYTYTITDDDTAGATMTQSAGTTEVTEGSVTDDTYTVVLTSQPTHDVTISLADSAGDVSLNPTSLTFTTANWLTPQTVTVADVNDAIAEGNHNGTVVHTPASTDSTYNSLNINNLSVSVVDNDSAGVSVTPSGGTTVVTEGSTTDDYTVVLTSEPTDNVVITVAGTTQATGAPTPLTFTPANWATAQPVTVTATNDNKAEGAHTTTLTHTAASTSDTFYNGIGVSSVNVSINDNETAGVTITPSEGSTTVTEAGTTDTYTLVLTSQPNGNVTVTPIIDDKISLSPSSVTFTTANWATPQTITITGVNDDRYEGNHASTINHSISTADLGYASFTSQTLTSITVNITDNDTAGVTIAELDGSTAVSEDGTTDTYTVVLGSEPTSEVTITITSGDTAQATVSPSTLTFTSDNWDTAQTVTVSAEDDSEVDGESEVTVSHSISTSDTNYSSATIASVTVTVTDNDTEDSGNGRNQGGSPSSPDCPQATCSESDIANCNLMGSLCGTSVSSISRRSSLISALSKEASSSGITYQWQQHSGKIITFPTVNGQDGRFLKDTKIIPGKGYENPTQRDLLFSLTEQRGRNGLQIVHYLKVKITAPPQVKDSEKVDGKVVAGDGNSGTTVTQRRTSDGAGGSLWSYGFGGGYYVISSTSHPPIIRTIAADPDKPEKVRIVVADPWYDKGRGIIVSLDPSQFDRNFNKQTINLRDPNLYLRSGVWIYEGSQRGAFLGYKLAPADLDGDQKPEVVALMPGVSHGAAMVFYVEDLRLMHTIYGKEGEQLKANLIIGVDLNGDDYGDPVMGVKMVDVNARSTPFRPNGGNNNHSSSLTRKNALKKISALHTKELMYMAEDGSSGSVDVSSATTTFNGLVAGSSLSSVIDFAESSPDLIIDTPQDISVATASQGDVNGDGLSDLVMGGADDCSIIIYFGDAGIGLDVTELTADSLITCDESEAPATIEIGDVTGDGIDDIVIGFSGGDGRIYIIPGVSSGADGDYDFDNAIVIDGTTDSPIGDTIVLTDQDGDGTADIYTSNGEDSDSILININRSTNSSGDALTGGGNMYAGGGGCGLKPGAQSIPLNLLLSFFFVSFIIILRCSFKDTLH